MVTFLTPASLAPFAAISEAKANEMIADAFADAVRIAPCLKELDNENPDDADKIAAVKAIMRRAILRWNDAGSAAAKTLTSGMFSQTIDNREPDRGLYWPREITDLQSICQTDESEDADGYMLDMTRPNSPAVNPLAGVVINAYVGAEPLGEWAEQ